MSAATIAPHCEAPAEKKDITQRLLDQGKKHPVLRAFDYLTLNVLLEMVAFDGEVGKLQKLYEMLAVVSALIASFSISFVLSLPSSLPSATGAYASLDSSLGTWLTLSAFGSVGLAVFNILCCSMVIVATQACPDPIQLMLDVPLGGVPILIVCANVFFLLSYLCAYLYCFLPAFAATIISWFSACFGILVIITFYIFSVYLPAQINAFRAQKGVESSAGSGGSSGSSGGSAAHASS